MIDDRQLLRLSRNLAAVLFFIAGLALVLFSIADFLAFLADVTRSIRTQSVSPPWLFGEWDYYLSVGKIVVGSVFVFRPNWLARKLIRPAPADTCPGCDYPIEPAASKCPECGLALAEHRSGPADQDQ